MKIPTLCALLAAGAVCLSPALAQQSANYGLREHALNGGGRPSAGEAPASPSFRVSVAAIGDSAAGAGRASASFRMDAGFVVLNPPPLEVQGLDFESKTLLVWNVERSAGTYNLYRDPLDAAGGGGHCREARLPAPSATDTEEPPTGSGFFYLATARNRLGEEGTRGSDSSGSPRPSTNACP